MFFEYDGVDWVFFLKGLFKVKGRDFWKFYKVRIVVF